MTRRTMALVVLAWLLPGIGGAGSQQVLDIAAASLGNPQQPSVARDQAGTVWLTFVTDGGAVWITSLASGQAAFSTPVKVRTEPDIAVGGSQGPKIALSGKRLLLTYNLFRFDPETAEPRGDGNVYCVTSDDGGRTWSAPVRVNSVPSSAQRAFQAVAAGPGPRVDVVWFDTTGDGVKVMAARSDDRGSTFGPSELVYASPSGTICECCRPNLAFSPQGERTFTFRNWLNGSRDIYVRRGDAPPVKVDAGTWPIKACPTDGGGMGYLGDTLVVTWRREATLYATTKPGQETPIGPGRRPQLGLGENRAVVVWENQGQLWTTDALAPGTPQPVAAPAAGATQRYAACSKGGPRIFVAWEEQAGDQLLLRGRFLTPQ